MDIAHSVIKLVAELTKYGEVVAGSNREKQLVEVIRGYLEDEVDDLGMESVEVLSWSEELCLAYIDGVPYRCSIHPPYDGYINIDANSSSVIYIENINEVDRLSKNMEGKLVVVDSIDDPNYVAVYSYILRKYRPLVIVFIDRLDTLRRIVSIDDLLARYERVSPPTIPSIHVSSSTGLKLKRASNIQIVAMSRLGPSYGYNVIARVNGRDTGTVYLTAHHDHWFSGVVDDMLGVSILVNLVHTTGFRHLKNSVVLAFFTAEEGLPNPLSSFYWLVGSRKHVVSNAYRLLDEVLLAINLDVIYRSRIRYATSNFLARGLLMKMGIDFDDLDHDSILYDSYAFTMLGIPSITLHNYPEVLTSGLYHSMLDDISVLDVDFVNSVIHSIMRLLRNSYSILDFRSMKLFDIGVRSLIYELASRTVPLELVLSLFKTVRRLESCDNQLVLARVIPLLHRIITTTYISKSIFKGEDIYERTSYIMCGKEYVMLPLSQELGEEYYKNVLYNLESLVYILRC